MYDVNWDKVYDSAYDNTMENLKYKIEKLDYSVEDIQKELDHLYIYQGHCMEGRSGLKEREIEGTVDAYHVFLRKQK